MGASALLGIGAALLVQHVELSELFHVMLFGYNPADRELTSIMSGGGCVSMAKPFAVVCLSSCYAGLFGRTGFLDTSKKVVSYLGEHLTPFAAVFFTAVLTSLITCNQTLSIMLTYQMCHDMESDREKLALYLENTAVLIPPLIPWSIACVGVLELINAPASCLTIAFYLYLVPLWNLICSVKHLTLRR